MTTKILINLDFLKTDKVWPPPSQKGRLVRYQKNQKLFDAGNADVGKVYNFVWSMGEREHPSDKGIWDWTKKTYSTMLNFQKKCGLQLK